MATEGMARSRVGRFSEKPKPVVAVFAHHATIEKNWRRKVSAKKGFPPTSGKKTPEGNRDKPRQVAGFRTLPAKIWGWKPEKCLTER